MIVNKQIADSLKELGYDKPCHSYYPGLYQDEKGHLIYKRLFTDINSIDTLAPTQEEVCKWFREKGLIILPVLGSFDYEYRYEIYKHVEETYLLVEGDTFLTYELAIEAGILETIKIYKNEN